MDIHSLTRPLSLACLPPDVTTEGLDCLANLYDEPQNPISESWMSLKPLKDYMTALFKTQSSLAKNTFEVFHVCPDLNDIVSSDNCTFSTPIHVIKNISEYSLTAYVEKKESDNLYFYLEYMSHTEQTNTCFKWSVSVYNTNRDDYLQLGESVLYLNDDQQITSEKLCAPVDTIHNFLNNSQFIIVWLIELVSPSEEFPSSLLAFENVRSRNNISDETYFESRIDKFFCTVLQQNQELNNESNAILAMKIHQSQKQLLENLNSVEEIKNDVSEMDKRLNDFFSNDRNSFNPCDAVSKTGSDFALRPISETDNAQKISNVSVKLNEKIRYKEDLNEKLLEMEKDTDSKIFLRRKQEIEKLLNINSASFGNDNPTNDANKQQTSQRVAPKETNGRRERPPVPLRKKSIPPPPTPPVQLQPEASLAPIAATSRGAVPLAPPPLSPPPLAPRPLAAPLIAPTTSASSKLTAIQLAATGYETDIYGRTGIYSAADIYGRTNINSGADIYGRTNIYSGADIYGRRLSTGGSSAESVSSLNDDYVYTRPDSSDFDVYETIDNFYSHAYDRKDCYDRERFLYEVPQFEMNLLLIGKTGQGKSALGNSVIGRCVFESRPSACSVTKGVAYEVAEYKGNVIKVVDMPGVGDTSLNEEEADNLIIQSLSSAIAINMYGYHAFLLVIKFGDRFTKESRLTIDVLKKALGENFVKKFCIIVVTNGDQFECKESFRDWINAEKGELIELVKECDNRVILFDNKTKEKGKRDGQLDALLDIIQVLALKNGCYTNDQFNMAKLSRDALSLEVKKFVIEENSMKEASLILEKLQCLQVDTKAITSPKTISILDQLKCRTITLLESLREQDRNTGVLQDLINHIQSLQNSINDESRLVDRIFKVMSDVQPEVQSSLLEKIRRKRKQNFLSLESEAQSPKPPEVNSVTSSDPRLSGEDEVEIKTMDKLWKTTLRLNSQMRHIKNINKKNMLEAFHSRIAAALTQNMKTSHEC